MINKRAGVTADLFGDVPARMMLSNSSFGRDVMGAADLAGTIHGFTTDDIDDEDLEDLDDAKSFIPGVGQSRIIRRFRNNAKDSPYPNANVAGEHWGRMVPALLLALAGAGIGAYSDYQDEKNGKRDLTAMPGTLKGALIGGGIGVGGELLGSLLAAVTDRRTAEEQKEHDLSPNIQNWLIPGVASYNYWKRVGRLYAAEEEAKAKKKLQKMKERGELALA